MTRLELEVHGIFLDRCPNGNWFVSWCGWGRRMGPNYQVALEHAHQLYEEKVLKIKPHPISSAILR